MTRRYNWRATAQPLRTDVSRAKESMSTGGKITLRRELIERGGSHEVWYGGEGGIRTHGPRKGTAVFETARFGRSRTSPEITPNRDH